MTKTYAQLEAEACELLLELSRVRRENARLRRALASIADPLYEAYMTAVRVDVEGGIHAKQADA